MKTLKIHIMTVLTCTYPLAITMGIAWLIGSFLEASLNIRDWTWNARCVAIMFGVVYGYALYLKVSWEAKE